MMFLQCSAPPISIYTAKFGVHGKEKGQFNGIFGIAVNKYGTIFVTEHGNKRLQIIAK